MQGYSCFISVLCVIKWIEYNLIFGTGIVLTVKTSKLAILNGTNVIVLTYNLMIKYSKMNKYQFQWIQAQLLIFIMPLWNSSNQKVKKRII